MKSIEIRSKIADLTKEFRNLADNLTDDNKTETEAKTSEILSEIDALEVRAAQFEKIEKVEADTETRNRSRRPLARLNATVEVSDAEDINENFRSFLKGESRGALNTSTGSAGETIPTVVSSEIKVAKKQHSQILDYANVINTDDNKPLVYTFSDDTNRIATLIAEGVDHGDASNAVISSITLYAHTFTTGILPVSKELLNSTGADIVGFVKSALSTSLGRGENLKFTKGTGTNEPQGFVTGASAGITAASNVAITTAELIELQGTLDYAYDPDAVWIMNQKTLGYIRNLTDGFNRSLIEPRLTESTPFRLLGKTIVINNDMDDIAAGKVPIVYGNLKEGFYVRFGGNLEINTYNDSALGRFNQVGFHGIEYTDSKVILPKVIKKLTMKA